MTVIIDEVDGPVLAACLVRRDKLVVNVARTHVLVIPLSILDLPCHVEVP